MCSIFWKNGRDLYSLIEALKMLRIFPRYRMIKKMSHFIDSNFTSDEKGIFSLLLSLAGLSLLVVLS
jgi:hypothetical protein